MKKSDHKEGVFGIEEMVKALMLDAVLENRNGQIKLSIQIPGEKKPRYCRIICIAEQLEREFPQGIPTE